MESTIIREYELKDVEEMIELGSMMHKEGEYRFLPYSKSKIKENLSILQQINHPNII